VKPTRRGALRRSSREARSRDAFRRSLSVEVDWPVGSAVASVVVVASIARWDLDGGATSASMTRSGSGAAGAATAIAGSTADAGAALDGAALAGALSNAAASRDSRPPPKRTAPASAAKAMTASVVHSLLRRVRGGVVERTDAASTAVSRTAAVTSGPKMRAASLDGLGDGMRAICRGHRNDPPLQSFERAHDCLIIATL
jgi:hypothetical protein